MIVQEFTVAPPDSDGDMAVQLVVAGENPTEHEVRLVRLTSCFRASDGSLFGESTQDEEVRLETGEEYTTSIQAGWLKAGFAGENPQELTAQVFATLYRREMFRLGEMAIPAKVGQLSRIDQQIESSCLGSDVSVLVLRQEQGDEGKAVLHFRCGVVNVSDGPIDHLVLKADLLDDDDAVIESDQTVLAMAPGVTRTFESQLWGLSPSKVKRARLKFSLHAYLPVARDTCEGASSAE